MAKTSAPCSADLAEGMQALRDLLTDEVHHQLVAGGEFGLDEAQTLRRWLVARKMNPKAAAADLAAHAAWRQAWAPQGRVLEHEVAADVAQAKAFLQGADRRGRGVIVLQAARHTLSDSAAQQRFISYVLDGAIAHSARTSNPDDKVAAVFDLTGLALRNCDAVGLKNVFSLLQAHYVERLSQLFMYGAPAIFWGLWRAVSPFVDPVTRGKVVFVAAGDTRALVEAMGPEVLPPYLGGSAALIPVEQAWQDILQQRAQQQQQQKKQAQQAQDHKQQQYGAPGQLLPAPVAGLPACKAHAGDDGACSGGLDGGLIGAGAGGLRVPSTSSSAGAGGPHVDAMVVVGSG